LIERNTPRVAGRLELGLALGYTSTIQDYYLYGDIPLFAHILLRCLSVISPLSTSRFRTAYDRVLVLSATQRAHLFTKDKAGQRKE